MGDLVSIHSRSARGETRDCQRLPWNGRDPARLPGLTCKGCKLDGSVDGASGPSLVSVKALPGPRGIPVPVRLPLQAKLFLGDSQGFLSTGMSRPRDLVGERLDIPFGDALLLERTRERLGVELEPSLFKPLILESLELLTRVTFRFSGVHDRDERFEVQVRRPKNERVIPLVDV